MFNTYSTKPYSTSSVHLVKTSTTVNCVATWYIYFSVFVITPYVVMSSTCDNISIVWISYCDTVIIISISIYRLSIKFPHNVYRRCTINSSTNNSNVVSIKNIYRTSYFNSLVSFCDVSWPLNMFSFINIWWNTYKK